MHRRLRRKYRNRYKKYSPKYSYMPDYNERGPEPEEEDPRDFVDRQLEYKGYTTLYFKCALETFIREWPRVDFHRAGKFMHWVRQTLRHAFAFGIERGELDNVVEQLDAYIFNAAMVRDMATPQGLVIHVVDVFNDCVRYAGERCAGFDAATLTRLYLPLLRFALDVDPAENEALAQHIQEEALNDFTDCQYPRQQSLARFLRPRLAPEELRSAQPADYSLQDVAVVLAAWKKAAPAAEALRRFAADLQDFYEYYHSDEYDRNYAPRTDEHGNELRQADLDELEDKRTISRGNVALAKRIYGKRWREHVYKLDGVIHFTRDNVLVQRYEDDYLPDEYRYLEREQRDVGDHWDAEIDDDGFTVDRKE